MERKWEINWERNESRQLGANCLGSGMACFQEVETVSSVSCLSGRLRKADNYATQGETNTEASRGRSVKFTLRFQRSHGTHPQDRSEN